MTNKFLKVRNFEKFQHYKQRNPPWIKIYSSMLDDYEFQKITDEAKFHCIGLMLLASRLDNVLPNDADWLSHKIGAKSEINIDLLVEINFLEFAESLPPTIEKEKASPVLCVDNVEIPETKVKLAHVSEFSMQDCLRYVETQTGVKNKHGLATHLHKTGDSDYLILAKLYPERLKVEDEKQFGPKREFTNEPCTVCFGCGFEAIENKGRKPCEHCKDEKGKPRKKEPKQ
jgi:hypothetical protein